MKRIHHKHTAQCLVLRSVNPVLEISKRSLGIGEADCTTVTVVQIAFIQVIYNI
jgi:hypothetical protein